MDRFFVFSGKDFFGGGQCLFHILFCIECAEGDTQQTGVGQDDAAGLHTLKEGVGISSCEGNGGTGADFLSGGNRFDTQGFKAVPQLLIEAADVDLNICRADLQHPGNTGVEHIDAGGIEGTISGFKSQPEYPIAETILPQLGSPPNTADLNKLEDMIDFAASLASSSFFAL